jgi:hypothetical protein
LSFTLPLRFARRLAALPLLVLGSCVAGGSGNVNMGDAQDAADTPVCDGQTLGELARVETVSDACKAELTPYLPASSDDARGRVVVLGSEQRDDGSLRAFVAGTDAGGEPLSTAAFAAARVSVRGDGGVFAESGAALQATAFGKLGEDALSLELVNDYSESMNLADLRVVQRAQHDLIAALPPIYEGEVMLFSNEVRVKQAFTTDRTALLGAVEYDTHFVRKLTALYDGMGNGLDSLTARSRPARVLMVATDGLENASVAYKKSDVVKTIADDGVFVIMLGALFANESELKSLAGPRGVYFYTPLYADLGAQWNAWISALAHGAAIDIPAATAQKRPLRLEIAGEDVEID